jgi:choice-of-anchor A domain-containing protein
LTALSAALATRAANSTFNPATGAFVGVTPGPSIWDVTTAELESFHGNYTLPGCLLSTPNPSTCDGVVNVHGTSYNSGTNTFNPLFAAPGLIFNFIDATSITLGNVWEASIIAPLANIQTSGGWIDGNVIATSVGTLGAIGHEIHQPLFDCSDNLCQIIIRDAEPGSLALLGAGLAALASLAMLRRRRQA